MLYIGRQRGLVDLGLLMIYEETVDGTEQEHGSYSRHEVVFLVKGTDFPRRVCSVEQQTDEIKIVDRIPGKVSFQRCPVNLFVVQGKRLGKELERLCVVLCVKAVNGCGEHRIKVDWQRFELRAHLAGA